MKCVRVDARCKYGGISEPLCTSLAAFVFVESCELAFKNACSKHKTQKEGKVNQNKRPTTQVYTGLCLCSSEANRLLRNVEESAAPGLVARMISQKDCALISVERRMMLTSEGDFINRSS